MARLFDNASNQHLYVASLPVTDYPFTMAAWARIDENVTGTVMELYNSGSAWDSYHRLYISTSYTACAASADSIGTAKQAITTEASAINTWVHVCGVYNSNTSRIAYIKGGYAVENTEFINTYTFSTYIDGICIGIHKGSSLAGPFSGRIAEAGIWNVALTANEIAALGAGVSPLGVRRGSLVGYWPVWGLHSPEIDLTVGHRNMTLSGTPTEAAHAPVVPFRAQLYSPPMIEGAVGGPVIPIFMNQYRRRWA